MLGLATTSTKTLKLIVPKDYTSQAKPSTLNYIVFSILPKNTKKKKKITKKCITYILSPLTPITIRDKVFSILPKNKEKNAQKLRNNKKINIKNTQKKTKTLEYKTIDITYNPPQYKAKPKTTKTLFKTITKTKKTHHFLKSKPKNKKISIIWENLRKRKKKNAKSKIKKSPTLLNTKDYILKYTFYDKKSILTCGDIESNPGPKFTLLLNHPQEHLEKYKTYFYKNTTQIKNEYIHTLKSFNPYLTHTHTENSNPHLKQFCINNQQCPPNHLFFAILVTLAPTPPQCNQLINEKLHPLDINPTKQNN
jgi:hypothetical protein